MVGAQKNRLIETVLLSTHNICFGWEIRKLNFLYSLLTKVLWGPLLNMLMTKKYNFRTPLTKFSGTAHDFACFVSRGWLKSFKLSGAMLPTNGFGQTDTGDYHNSMLKWGDKNLSKIPSEYQTVWIQTWGSILLADFKANQYFCCAHFCFVFGFWFKVPV